MTTLEILKQAKKSAPALALLTSEEKNQALLGCLTLGMEIK